MNMPRPFILSSPSFGLMKLPSTWHLGQNLCIIEPHGFCGSVPKYDVPFLPAWKPGADFVIVRSMTAFALVDDLILKDFPSSERVMLHLSA